MLRSRHLMLLGLALGPLAVLAGQDPAVTGAQPALTPVDSVVNLLAGSRRAKISRAQLEATLAEIEQALGSSGYSGALKSARQAEAELIRRRLEEGDLFPGDVLAIQVLGDPQMTNNYTVTPRRTIVVPGIPNEIPVTGMLRSEIEDYLARVVAQYVRNPTVWVEPLMRISIFGAVNRPGFLIVPASMPLPDIVMQFAGGPTGNVDPERSKVTRGDKEVLPGAAIEEAIREARSIDALNLQSGDRIELGAKPARNFLGRALGILGGAASLTFLIVRIF